MTPNLRRIAAHPITALCNVCAHSRHGRRQCTHCSQLILRERLGWEYKERAERVRLEQHVQRVERIDERLATGGGGGETQVRATAAAAA